jgi:acetyl-CoA acetyltransferase
MYGLGAPIPYYAMSAQRYLFEHHYEPRDLALVCTVLREFAARNPLAEHRGPLSVDDVLSARTVCPPLTLPMCSSFSSGAAAVVVASEDVARECARSSGRPRIGVRAIGEHHEPAHFLPPGDPLSRFPSAELAAAEAYREAGIGPHDVDVAEVYGVFAATELILYEDLGFCERGSAPRAVQGGKTRGRGNTVMNPSGGRLSLGHPAGATPLYSLVEVATQLRGQAAERQVEGARTGLVHAEHGMLNGSMVALFQAEA